MSEIIDDDEDEIVTIEAKMTKAMKRWITFDANSRRFILKPTTENSPLNLTSIHVTLSDTQNQSDYYVNIWVLKGEVSPPDPDPEPEPKP